MFTRGILHTTLAVALALASFAVYADDAKPDATKSDTKTDVTPPVRGGGRLVKPFSDLKDLSADQTAKLKEIHAKYLAQKKEIEAKEKEESMAVLSDDQKKELTDAGAKAAADKKAAAAAKAEKPAAAPEAK